MSIRNLLQVAAILSLVSANMSACASQSKLNEKAKVAIEAAAEKDTLDNRCFVIRSNEDKSNFRKENVVCPIVGIL